MELLKTIKEAIEKNKQKQQNVISEESAINFFNSCFPNRDQSVSLKEFLKTQLKELKNKKNEQQ